MCQSYRLTFFFLFLASALAKSSFGLDINDTMSLRVTDILKHNIIVINRGSSDGLIKNSHFKINDSQGYRARGLVLYTKSQHSFVKLYRILEENNLSRSTQYTLTSMKSSLLAPHMRKYTKRNYRGMFKNFKPKSSTRPYRVSPDFPTRTTRRELKNALKYETK